MLVKQEEQSLSEQYHIKLQNKENDELKKKRYLLEPLSAPDTSDKLPATLAELFIGNEFRYKNTYMGMFVTDNEREFESHKHNDPSIERYTQYFGGHTPKVSKEQYIVNGNGIFGGVLHDMCHFVEIDERRMRMYEFGLPLQSGTTPYKVDNRENAKAIERELRVLALEMNIIEKLDVEAKIVEEHQEDQLKSISGISGWTNFCETRDPREVLAEYRKLPQHSFESFRKEWHRRLKIVNKIENKLKSKNKKLTK